MDCIIVQEVKGLKIILCYTVQDDDGTSSGSWFTGLSHRYGLNYNVLSAHIISCFTRGKRANYMLRTSSEENLCTCKISGLLVLWLVSFAFFRRRTWTIMFTCISYLVCQFLHAVTFSHIVHLDVITSQIELKMKVKAEISIRLDNPLPSLYTQYYRTVWYSTGSIGVTLFTIKETVVHIVVSCYCCCCSAR